MLAAHLAFGGLGADVGGAWFGPPSLDGVGSTSASELEHCPLVGLAWHIPASGSPGRRAGPGTSARTAQVYPPPVRGRGKVSAWAPLQCILHSGTNKQKYPSRD
jgi:hypothetical protein